MSVKEIIQRRAEGILVELVSTGRKDSVLPLVDKHPELLTKELTDTFIKVAYHSELNGAVAKDYTKDLALSIKDIKERVQKAKEEERIATGESKERSGQEIGT